MKSPIPYFGAKTSIADKIVSLFPGHMGYIEPFAGSLAILFAKSPSRIEVVNDIDRRIVTFWKVLRDRPDELIRLCALTPHARAEASHALGTPADDDLELAREVFALLTQNRSRLMRSAGWRFWADPRAGMYELDVHLGRLAPAAARLLSVSLECRPALEVIDQFGAFDDNLLYVDPPYVKSTLSGSGRYRFHMSDAEHVELAAALRACKANVVVSGFANEIYDEELSRWQTHEIKAFNGNGLDSTRREVLWCNFEIRNLFNYEST